MAKITIAHRPELTEEDVRSIFERHFGDKYQVLPRRKGWRESLVVKESDWIGVSVRLNQKANETSLHFEGCPPRTRAGCILFAVVIFTMPLGLLAGLFYKFVILKGIADEVRAFIETAEEFR
jgi:hypothetical protein